MRYVGRAGEALTLAEWRAHTRDPTYTLVRLSKHKRDTVRVVSTWLGYAFDCETVPKLYEVVREHKVQAGNSPEARWEKDEHLYCATEPEAFRLHMEMTKRI